MPFVIFIIQQKKEMSIWWDIAIIRNDIKKSAEQIESDDGIGTLTCRIRSDILSTVMVCLPKTRKKEKALVNMLKVLFDGSINVAERENILETEYDLKMSREGKEHLVKMCNLSDWIEEQAIEKGIKKGIEQGREQGREEGREKTIITLYTLYLEGYIDEKVMIEKAGMEKEEFYEKLDKLEKENKIEINRMPIKGQSR